MNYKTKNVCSKEINFEVVDGRLHNVRFLGGCNGNLQGIGRLVEGMDIDRAIESLRGISCGGRDTSCPDQLTIALEEYKTAMKN